MSSGYSWVVGKVGSSLNTPQVNSELLRKPVYYFVGQARWAWFFKLAGHNWPQAFLQPWAFKLNLKPDPELVSGLLIKFETNQQAPKITKSSR